MKCTCARQLDGGIALRNPECPRHGEAMEPQNYDEITACLELLYGNTLLDDATKADVREACIDRIIEMRES